MLDPISFDTFSTASFPAPQRLSGWNDFIAEVFPGLAVDSPRALMASWRRCSLGAIQLSSAKSERAKITRSGADHGKLRAKVHLQHRGRSMTIQGGRSVVMAAGDMTVVSGNQPYSISLTDQNDMFVFECEVESLGLSEAELQQAFAARIEGSLAPVRMLREFSATILRQPAIARETTDEGRPIGDMLIWLLGQCLKAPGAPEEDASKEKATRNRVLDFVEQNLTEPDLRTGMIAAALSLSPRTVQDVFAGLATTATEYIQSRRLAAAARVLETGADYGSLTELALDLGFNSSGYFSRCFRAHFGKSPREYRAVLRRG